MAQNVDVARIAYLSSFLQGPTKMKYKANSYERYRKSIFGNVGFGTLLLGIAILALVTRFPSTGLASNEHRSLWIVIPEHIATALIIFSLWHVVEKYFTGKIRKEEIVDYIDTAIGANSLVQHGLFSIHPARSSEHDEAARKEIRESTAITVVLGSGKKWLDHFEDAMEDRFNDGTTTKTTTIIFVHPKSKLIPVAAEGLDKERARYEEQIYASATKLRTLAIGSGQELIIVGHNLINFHSVLIADNRAILSTFCLSKKKSPRPPVFVFDGNNSGSHFHSLKRDVEELKRICTQFEQNTLISKSAANE